MPTYFVEYSIVGDHRRHCFFGNIKDDTSEENANEMIKTGLSKAYGESVTDIEITKQTDDVRPNHSVRKITLSDFEEEGFL